MRAPCSSVKRSIDVSSDAHCAGGKDDAAEQMDGGQGRTEMRKHHKPEDKMKRAEGMNKGVGTLLPVGPLSGVPQRVQ